LFRRPVPPTIHLWILRLLMGSVDSSGPGRLSEAQRC